MARIKVKNNNFPKNFNEFHPHDQVNCLYLIRENNMTAVSYGLS